MKFARVSREMISLLKKRKELPLDLYKKRNKPQKRVYQVDR